MKIAFVVHDFVLHRGHSRYAVELARRFRGEHDVHVWAQAADPMLLDGITFHSIRASRRGAAATILSFLPGGTFAGRACDIKHAQGLTGLRQDVVTAHMCLRAWRAAVPSVSRHRLGRLIFKQVIERLEARLYASARLSPVVIAVSERVRHDLAAWYGRTDEVAVISNGVDTAHFSPEARERLRVAAREGWAIAEGSTTALWVGNPDKGLDSFLGVLTRVPEWHGLVVSEAPTTLLAGMVAAHGLTERVRLVGRLVDPAPAYAAADLFLFPTRYDPFGLVVLEAMAMGLPVVVSGAAGVSELIDDGRSGLIVGDPQDVDGLVAAVTRLSEDAGLAETIGAQARRVAESNDWDLVAARTLEVYRRVVETKAR